MSTHGEAGNVSSAEYRVWSNMWTRCTNADHTTYKNYGARGIFVCQRWRRFEAFLRDMGRRPSPKHSIERRDNDGPYSPKNCHWGTVREQARNKRGQVRYIVNGEARLLCEWAEVTGVPVPIAWERIHALGWPVAKAIQTPVQRGRPTHCQHGHPFVETGRFEGQSQRCTICKLEYDRAYRARYAARLNQQKRVLRARKRRED